MKQRKIKQFWVLTPVFGILLFAPLYLAATWYYPGGSQIDQHSTGFSWINNYWCNLLNEYAINGQHNGGRPIALTGMVTLCLSLSLFWYLFPRYIHFGIQARVIIQLSGTLSMMIAIFLFTNFHDAITYVASFIGLIAVTGTFIGLYKIKWFGLFGFGILNMLLVGLNNYLYYTKGMIIYLPVIQKITFVSFLLWICWINVGLYRKTERELIL
ncbi:MAG: hypothetical protein SH848_11090 [Saprospiraceae bacterium]|nr:hypothetical protein [Saprospiraceae bacterium]MDZ4704466.1 hypothetical protein [Saprospiraceae bacterium]